MVTPEEIKAMEHLISSLVGMGGTGIFFAVMLWYGHLQHKTHKEERLEWREDTKEVNQKFIRALEESTKTLHTINSKIDSHLIKR